MIKLKAFEETKQVEEEIKKVYIRAVQSGDDVIIKAVNENGRHILCGALFRLKSDGTFFSYGTINRSLGFDLDGGGHIKEDSTSS